MTDTTLDSVVHASPRSAADKWSRRQTLLFVVAASASLWGLIVMAAVQLF